jgi:hypothetical protein
MRPNIFSFAPRELSQDAALCWMLAWADPAAAASSEPLHLFGRELLTMLFERAGRVLPSLKTVSVGRQEGRIDVHAIINGEVALIIEHKVGSMEHSRQLERYLDTARTWGYAQKPVAIYLQNGEQFDYRGVTRSGFTPGSRHDLLAFFKGEAAQAAATESDVLSEYMTYLQAVDDEFNSFVFLPPNEWGGNTRRWFGFFSSLDDIGGADWWGYVPNARGGFSCYTWASVGNATAMDCIKYLQLEDSKLCFKIRVANPEDYTRLRGKWHERFMAAGERAGLPLVRPPRFGRGETMTVAMLDGDYRLVGSDGNLDLDATIHLLRDVEAAFGDAVGEQAPQMRKLLP